VVAPIKQIVTVGAGGRIESPASQLAPGTRVEVTVQVDEPPAAKTPAERLALLRELRQSLALDEKAAAEWIAEIQAERDACGPGE
jgi:hypothetical protein